MLELIKFLLSTVGLTFIIVHFYIFKWFREYWKERSKLLYKLFNCYGCVGFYSGLIVYFLYKITYLIPIININLGELINYGFMGSFVSYVSYLLLCPLIKKYD